MAFGPLQASARASVPACPFAVEEPAEVEESAAVEELADEDAVTAPLRVGVTCGNPAGDPCPLVLVRARFVLAWELVT